jgi:putative heme-binding domain-containing protein
LSGRPDFADDQNIPLMTWYAAEPLVEQDQDRFVQLGGGSKIPIIRRHVARRVASIPGNISGIDQLVRVMRSVQTETHRSDLLSGLLTGLEGIRRFDLPPAWSETYAVLKESKEESVREQAQRLALIFEDPQAIQQLKQLAGDSALDKSVRHRAIKALAGSRIAGFDEQLIELAADEHVQMEALAGLAEYDHPATVKTVLQVYSSANATTRQAALQTLASRASWAKALMAALGSGEIARTEITAFTARQIHSLGDKQLSKDVERLWGPIRETPKDRARLIANYKPQLTATLIQSSNRENGRALFQKNCANCHRLFDAGTLIGPDLTGAQRTNVDYLLQNLLDPSASISKDYQMQIVATTNGRVVTGLLIEESDNAITIQTATEKVIVPRNEIEEQKISEVSMMPEGILQKMTHDEVRDLFAYLMGSEQVALP